MDLHLCWVFFVANVQGLYFFDERFLYLIYLWTTMHSTENMYIESLTEHLHNKYARKS